MPSIGKATVLFFCLLRALNFNIYSFFFFVNSEVIEKKPEEFKISCLRDIQMLFPSHSNPFYAGYGNRVNVRIKLLFNLLPDITHSLGIGLMAGCVGVPGRRDSYFQDLYNQSTWRAEIRNDTVRSILVS